MTESGGKTVISVLVSINCIAYNHEKYIAQAIESFLMQKTDFDYEILIHDDASWDRTAAVIGEYARLYPDIIRPLYQTENQYSKGVKVGTMYNLSRARGKYIAVCEGDDYWTDRRKLQKQVDYMEAHPNCSMCFHAVEIIRENRKPTGQFIKPYNENRLVPVEDIIIGGGPFIGTNSMIYPRKCMDNAPDFYLRSPVGDFPLALYLAIQGTVYYINETMSAYRTGVAGSWTSHVSASRDKQIEVRNGLINMLNGFNEYTGYKYRDSVSRQQAENQLLLLIARGEIKALQEDAYQGLNKGSGKYIAAMILLNKYCPYVYNKLRKYKKYIIAKINQ